MTINQLKYVLMVSKSTSMREAAAKLFLSQPALTAAVRELEEELGIIIFERTNKGTILTEEGREFITFAKQAISHYTILEDRYLTGDREKEHFSVSAQHYNFAVHAFTNLIRKYEPEKYVFSFHETRTNEVLNHVKSWKSEIGILSFSGDNKNILWKILNNNGLVFIPLMERSTYAYVWHDHEIAEWDEVSLEQLRKYPCVAFSQGSEDDFYLKEEALANYEFPRMIQSDDRATSLEIIAELGGFSVGSGMLTGENEILKGLKAVKIKEEDPLTIGYIYRKESRLSDLGRKYVEELEKYRELPVNSDK